MRHTHTLTHNPSHLLAYSLLVSLFTIAAGDCMLGHAQVAAHSTLRKSVCGVEGFLFSSPFNQIFLTCKETPDTDCLNQQLAGLRSGWDSQPLSVQQQVVNHNLIYNTARFDAAITQLRLLPFHMLGRVRQGKIGQHRLNSFSKVKISDSDSEDGEDFAIHFQSINPQLVLPGFSLKGTLLGSSQALSKEVLSLNFQVIKVFEPQASSPYSIF